MDKYIRSPATDAMAERIKAHVPDHPPFDIISYRLDQLRLLKHKIDPHNMRNSNTERR